MAWRRWIVEAWLGGVGSLRHGLEANDPARRDLGMLESVGVGKALADQRRLWQAREGFVRHGLEANDPARRDLGMLESVGVGKAFAVHRSLFLVSFFFVCLFFDFFFSLFILFFISYSFASCLFVFLLSCFCC